jgi:hypothetical protein
MTLATHTHEELYSGGMYGLRSAVSCVDSQLARPTRRRVGGRAGGRLQKYWHESTKLLALQ